MSSKIASKTGPAPRVEFTVPQPPFRRLQGYAIDPSLATELETKPVSKITFPVPWESLRPGPSGEYLEVIDADPGSNSYYEPVNLDDAALLAQDGLPPSEGSPQFHQQMVYAVASLTIQNFEHALGRRTLWRPGPPPEEKSPKDDSVFVEKLRIYPHALRERNAYYTPARIALLFGYFKASADAPGEHMGGSMVFTCLSHDIIAHETTHALLDGMSRSFLAPTNPDVHAFHEAFADIVALFQHFTFPEILFQQIVATRGAISSQENLLGQLAGQFGRSTGLRGALRDAIGTTDKTTKKWIPREPDPAEIATTLEPHARGAILVAAVFDAFLSIYRQRTADLLRLATGGSGVLQPGAIHPELAQRLANEAAKAARHVLTMCVRALDYCPPVDITFGEYLRAIITADYDIVANDDLNYRVAFLQAFRRRGIYPGDVRTLSIESLLWRSPANDERRPSSELENSLAGLRNYSAENLYTDSREAAFKLEREMRSNIHDWLKEHFADDNGVRDAEYLGLDRKMPFEVRTARIAYRSSPDGGMFPQLLVGVLQETRVPVNANAPKGPQMSFVGGCTLVADLRTSQIRYCIRKPAGSQSRLERQREFATAARGNLRATYFGAETNAEPFAALHRGI